MLVSLALAGVSAAVPARAQERPAAPQDGAGQNGGFYDLGDYGYFAPETAAVPSDAPAPTDGSAPQAPNSSQPSASEPSGTTATTTPPLTPASSAAPSEVAAPGTGTAPIASAATGSPVAYPKGDLAGARADGTAFGKGKRSGSKAIATSTDLGSTIPGYTGATLPHETLFDDPDALTAQGTAAAVANDPWRTVTDPTRPAVTLGTDVLAGAKAVADDPASYLDGQSLEAANGSCKPLPPGDAGTAYYEAMCEEGAQPYDEPRSCRIPLVIQTEGSVYWEYQCHTDQLTRGDGALQCAALEPGLTNGGCSLIDQTQIGETCLQWAGTPTNPWCAEPGEPVYRNTYSCPAQLPSGGGIERNTLRIVSESRDESQCAIATAQASCTQSSEVCTGSDPQTRIVNGLSVTRPCWEWERTYQCAGTRSATDCGELAANTQCTYLREECLDDPQVGECKVATKVYRCPLPGGAPDEVPQYICGDDVYCIDGECEPVEREASTEFKDALVGLHALGQANAEFDEASLTLFSGTRETCHKKLFGLSNCCSGKGVPLLTPFLCNAAERELDKKDDAGLCHRVGSFCSDSILGVCVTRKDAFCCFESKLSRILQEQGRLQINKPWGKPKTETCKGFTIEEFQLLDLSLMDFTEVYAEFVDAAKLPSEIETAQQIQTRIEQYLAGKTPPPPPTGGP